MSEKHICTKCSEECMVDETLVPLRSSCCAADVIPFGDTALPNPETCKHETFNAGVRCVRDVQEDKTIKFSAEVDVTCAVCKTPMSFIGATLGSGVTTCPHTDQLGIKIVLPFRPGIEVITRFLADRAPVAGDGSLSGGRKETL